MVEAVGDDGVGFVEQRLEHPAIGVEAGGEEDRVVLAEMVGDRLLELAMEGLRAADETHRGHAEAEIVHRALRRRDDVGMVGEAEIIVGAEIDRLALAVRPGDADPPALRPGDQPLAFGEAGGLDFVERRAEVVEERRRSWIGPVVCELGADGAQRYNIGVRVACSAPGARLEANGDVRANRPRTSHVRIAGCGPPEMGSLGGKEIREDCMNVIAACHGPGVDARSCAFMSSRLGASDPGAYRRYPVRPLIIVQLRRAFTRHRVQTLSDRSPMAHDSADRRLIDAFARDAPSAYAADSLSTSVFTSDTARFGMFAS